MCESVDSRLRMRRALRKTLPWALCVLVTGCTAPAPARPSGPAATRPAMSLEEQTRELASGSAPTDMHTSLAPLCGSWDVSVVALDAGGAETELAQGTGELESILGGRFLAWRATLSIAGAPRTTTGFLGFDVRTKRY